MLLFSHVSLTLHLYTILSLEPVQSMEPRCKGETLALPLSGCHFSPSIWISSPRAEVNVWKAYHDTLASELVSISIYKWFYYKIGPKYPRSKLIPHMNKYYWANADWPNLKRKLVELWIAVPRIMILNLNYSYC